MPVPIASWFDAAVLPYRISATSHRPAWIAAAAWLTCATNEEPPMFVPSSSRGFRFRYSASETMPIAPIDMLAANRPSTSRSSSPQSSSAPRADSAMIWNSVLSGAQRVGCS